MNASRWFLGIWMLVIASGNLMAELLPRGRFLLVQAEMSTHLQEMLQQQDPVNSRRKTVAPVPLPAAGAGEAALAVPTSPQEVDKLKRVQRLIEDLEKQRGTAPGTVTARPAVNGGVSLEHDLPKMRQNYINFGASPFGGDAFVVPPADNMSAVVTPAEVEYRVDQSHDAGEQVIAIRSSGDVAATAFKSGEAPVSLEVATAGLTARQIEGPGDELPVLVQVGDQSQQLKPGDVARFGKLQVVIQASSNSSAKRASIEGPPYALRLRIQSIQ
jgi:hypothetical protein